MGAAFAFSDAACCFLSPPKVASVIASQKDSLTVKRRRIAGRTEAAKRKARGEVPGFLRKPKAKG